jgi:hypothetical protein
MPTRDLSQSPFQAAQCGEFPNDNDQLHLGAVWTGVETGPAVVYVRTGAGAPEYDYDHDHDSSCDDGPVVIEVVDELTFADTVDEAPDPFACFVGALTEVALSFGADPEGVHRLRALLGQARVDGVVADPGALAWQGILRGESEDFGPCGAATLDEWASSVVARVVAGGGRAEAIRRELRSRGVAAFGFMAAAA